MALAMVFFDVVAADIWVVVAKNDAVFVAAAVLEAELMTTVEVAIGAVAVICDW